MTRCALVLALCLTACVKKVPPPDPWTPEALGPLQLDLRRLEVNGSVVRFLETGRTDQPVPFVMVHGIGGRLEHFAPLMIDAAPDHRVLAFDLPGFGESTNPEKDFRISYFVSTLRAFLDQLGVEKANLVCHSMGGQVCIAFTLENPERVKTLTLLAAAGTYDARTYTKNILKKQVGLNVGSSETSKTWMLELMVGGDQSLVKRLFLKTAMPLSALASFSENLRARLRQLRVPTLILWGTDDEIFPVDDAGFLLENIQGSELHLIEGATHMPFEGHSAQILEWIDQFTARQEKPK